MRELQRSPRSWVPRGEIILLSMSDGKFYQVLRRLETVRRRLILLILTAIDQGILVTSDHFVDVVKSG